MIMMINLPESEPRTKQQDCQMSQDVDRGSRKKNKAQLYDRAPQDAKT